MTDESEPTDETEQADEYDRTQSVERTDHGLSITTELKRGTDTRDQDKHVVKAKGGDVEEAVQNHAEGMDYLEDEVLDRARNFDPERDEGDDGD